MKIAIVGGGPAGLYFALIARKNLPAAEIVVYEQNPKGATYGFGIVLADRGLNRLKAADPESARLIVEASFVSRHRIVTHREQKIFIEGGGYGVAIARLRLLDILQRCCEAAGVEIRYDQRLEPDCLPQADLLVGADGVNSVVRQGMESEFGTSSYLLTNKIAWYGTRQHFPYPIISFKTVGRHHFWAAAYAYSERMSTFAVECDGETWEQSGIAAMDDDARKIFAEELFAEELNGYDLISNKSIWHSLPVTRSRNWSVGNRVLLGDALHSAHPTIGSGTRIAMEDSIALVDALCLEADIPAAVAAFQRSRAPAKQKLIDAAEKSFNWYENVGPRLDALDPVTFVFDFMTRTGRIKEQRLLAEYPRFMERYENEWRRFAHDYADRLAPPTRAG